ncbi:N-acetylglucosamine-6-phosphate deacetylase [Clostridia bacterium]|nr:N-acetylglucosamine-6-phosphate deacetylase [Clostridia bacterium]
MKTLFKNYKLILTDRIGEAFDLLVANGRIVKIGRALPNYGCKVCDGAGQYLSPGFIDIHVHGGAGFDFADADPDEYLKIADFHARHGTTTIFPTLAGGTIEDFKAADNAFQNAVDRTKTVTHPSLQGLHVEGPFINPAQAGALNPEYTHIIEENYYKELFSSCPNIKRLTVAPELEGSEALAQYMTERGLIPSIGHTDATCEQVLRAFGNGYRLMTHFYSAMPSVRRVDAYRVAGAVEAGYLTDDMYVEIIADGSHLPGNLLRLVCKVKRKDRVILITDAIRGAGMQSGATIVGGRKSGIPAIVEDDVAKMPDKSAFAGSVATADRLIRVMREETDMRLYEIVNMMTANPAAAMGLSADKGTLEEGKVADFAVFDENINVTEVYVAGEKYERK